MLIHWGKADGATAVVPSFKMDDMERGFFFKAIFTIFLRKHCLLFMNKDESVLKQ